MAYQSLYRRYRSQKFSELRGQGHITSALKTAVAEDRFSHAYLFSGPRGTGKTSTARILAKALNCENVTDGEPCGECESCLAIERGKSFDLHELDAASNNKVEDVRDLISKVHLGSPGRTKVYILDEVHMLSAGAENALLKTLEEPPDHVVFVLCTTEPHKVVQTIRSRTQHFEFHLLPADDLADHVRFIIEDAGLEVDDAAIDYVLTQGGGSARDTLSALDLVAAAGGVPAGSDVGVALAKAIGAGSPEAAIAAVQEGLTTGQEPRIIGETTVDVLRNAFLASMGAPLDHLSDGVQAIATELAGELGAPTLTRSLEAIGQALVEMRQAPDPRVPLEVSLLKLCGHGSPPHASSAPNASPAPATSPTPAGGAAPAGGGSGDPAVAAKIQALEHQVAALQAEVRALQAGGGVAPAGQSPAATQPSPGGHASAAPAEQPASPAPTGPAAAARERLSEITAKAPPSPRAKRRGQDRPTPSNADAPSAQPPAAQPPATQPPAAAPPAAEPPTTEPPTAEPPTTQPPAVDPQTPAAQTSAPADASPPAQQAPPAAGSDGSDRPALSAALTLASVTAAFEQQLDGVRQKARVRFRSGRVVGVEGTTITFGAANPIHQDRCNEVKDEIEGALAAHFGHPVSLTIIVDDNAPSPTMDPAKIETRPAVELSDDEDDVGPVEELRDATDQSANGLERLTKAFPGSTVVEPDPNQERP